ncbi:MAG: FAD-dependent oxidoreductase [Firmicutes bacterium]|uniref:FAD-dependent oxidoreductase n=1 Tax=Candidatus Onthovivens merdipullorum TaxID=2840889 RepID=A0A9D9DKE5_9BACL|nr:FAD-dependent oxidoreductase [Candidatus Onthovivens merdipullorum]
MKEIYDLIIIGAGPSGVSAAIYSNRSGLKTLVIEKNAIGGQVINAYEIENYPGFPKVHGFDLALSFSEQLKYNEIKVEYDEVISVIKQEDDIFKIITKSSREFYSKYVVLALGSNPKKLGINKEDEFIGKGVSYCATCDGAFYRNKDVAVIGGGNSAITEAIYLSEITNKVYVIVRNKLRADNVEISRMKNRKNIEVLEGFQIKELLGNEVLNGVLLTNNDGSMIRKLDVSGIFIYIGQLPPTKFLSNLNILNKDGYIEVNEHYETKVKNLYAIGDVIPKHLRQIVNAVSDGALVIDNIKNINNF